MKKISMLKCDFKSEFKGIIKLALILVLILILGLLFLNTWFVHYHKLLRMQYILKGNIFMMAIYMILLYIFMLIFDSNNISEYRTMGLIFSETLVVISCNVFVYFVMITPAIALGFIKFMPIIYLIIKDIIVIVIWSNIVRYIFKKCFPLNPMLLISSKESLDETIFKFSKRDDIYDIKEKIAFDDNIENVYKKCDEYNDIIIGDITSENRNDIIKHCFNNSRNIYVIPKLSDILLKYSDDVFTFDTPIYLSTSFGLSFESRIFKRTFDIIVSLFVILVFFPIWLIVALLVKLEDGGPIFYMQERITYDEKIFSIIKFRSMKVGSDLYVSPTMENDERVTRVGKLIRKFHIDEIPQFINVLIGDMSVVGPRPERKEHVDLYKKEISEFVYRFKVKAGITGLAQIYGKYNTKAIDKLKLDLIYIKKYSLLFDIELMLRTFKVLINKDNTEGFDKEKEEYIRINTNRC